MLDSLQNFWLPAHRNATHYAGAKLPRAELLAHLRKHRPPAPLAPDHPPLTLYSGTDAACEWEVWWTPHRWYAACYAHGGRKPNPNPVIATATVPASAVLAIGPLLGLEYVVDVEAIEITNVERLQLG